MAGRKESKREQVLSTGTKKKTHLISILLTDSEGHFSPWRGEKILEKGKKNCEK